MTDSARLNGDDQRRNDNDVAGAPCDDATAVAPQPLTALNRMLALLRDRVGGVVLGHHNGFYLAGPKGNGKTHAVDEALSDHGQPYYLHSGHLTPMGLFELLAEKPDQIILLDDVAELLTSNISLQHLLAAIGIQPGGERVVKYRRQGSSVSVVFTGRIILISNLKLRSTPLLLALKSRLHYLWYDPSDVFLASMMRDIASRGWPSHDPQLSPQECLEVADYLIAESERLGCRLDLRVLIDKSFPDYLQFKNDDTECDWRDLVTATLEEKVIEPARELKVAATREARKQNEQQLAREIIAQHATREERLAAWAATSHKSERAFYRRCEELRLKL